MKKSPSNKHQVAHKLKPKVVKEKARDQQAKTKRLSTSGDKKSRFLLLLKKTVSLYKKLPGFTKLILVAILIIFVVIPEVESWPPKLYLLGKYGQVFHVKKTTGPRWIGQEYTYYGEAYPLFEFGDKRIRFNVNCGAFGDCVDFYLERSWARSEENKIRQYLGSELFKNSKVKVNIIARVDRYDLKTPVSNLDYYLKNNNSHLFEYYLISFDTKTKNITEEDVEHGKLVVKKLISYINERKLGENGRFKDYLSVSHTIISDGDEIAKCGIDLNKESDIKEDCFKKERKGLYFK